MAKSSVGLAFSSLSDNFRVGFLTVAKPGSEPILNNQYAKFVPLKDFGGTDKVQWFSAIQNIKTGGTSPARNAGSRGSALRRQERQHQRHHDSVCRSGGLGMPASLCDCDHGRILERWSGNQGIKVQIDSATLVRGNRTSLLWL